jgi:N-acetylmuramoyl-L-alanine amidase
MGFLSARRTARRTAGLLAGGTVAALVVGISVAGARPASPQRPAVSDDRQREAVAAAREFGVPPDVLLAISYALTAWSPESAGGGYGPMHLTDVDAARWTAGPAGQGRGDGTPPTAATLASPALHTLLAAARLTRVPAERVRTDQRENLRGGAALLASYALEANGGQLPATVAGWYGAIASYGTGGDPMAGRAFADDVLGLLQTGVPPTVVSGQRLQLAGRPGLTLPSPPRLPAGFGGADAADCPRDLACRFVPAGYGWTDRTDPAGYGNYDPADRPADGNPVRFLVVHGTAGSYDAVITAAQQPASRASVHYVVRGSDGAVTQLVRTMDIAWHAGNWTLNTESVGIEMAGGPPTEQGYRSLARLVRWLAARYRIPLDRQHVLAGDEVPNDGVTGSRARARSADPGRQLDWSRLMTLAGAPIRPHAWRAGRVVTIAAPAVVLRTQPLQSAPALSETPAAGQSYAVAALRGEWIEIWFGGRLAWLADPGARLTVPGEGVLVSPAPGAAEIPVYSRVAPEPSAYPAGVPVSHLVPLPERIPAGQEYVVTGPIEGQDYYARFDGAQVPANHTVVTGSTRFVMVTFDHRQAFLAADDVALAGLD